MGIIKKAKQSIEGYKKGRAERREKERPYKEAYDVSYQKGRVEGARERGYAEGKKRGKGGTGIGSWLPAVQHSLNSAEKTFGLGSGVPLMGTRLDEDIGNMGVSMNLYGGPGGKHKPAGQRVTRITKSGVTITEPATHATGKAGKQKPQKNIFEQLDEDSIF